MATNRPRISGAAFFTNFDEAKMPRERIGLFLSRVCYRTTRSGFLKWLNGGNFGGWQRALSDMRFRSVDVNGLATLSEDFFRNEIHRPPEQWLKESDGECVDRIIDFF